MRKQLLGGIAAVATLGFASAQAEIVPVQFVGTFSTSDMDAMNMAPGATDPNFDGLNFQITLNYDTDTDELAGAMIGVDTNSDGTFDASDMFEFFDALVIDAPAGSDANAIDVLDIELASYTGAAAGAHNIRFEFFNTFLDSDSLGDAFAALAEADDMSMLICSHFLFNFGGFKYTGELTGNITFPLDPDPIPVPGAAVLMLSGLAAAGAATARRRRNV